MQSSEELNKKLDIIVNGSDKLAEIITIEELRELLQQKTYRSLWGISPKILHLGYDRLIAKQLDLMNVGFKHIIIIADQNILLEKEDDPNLEDKIKYVISYFKFCCNLKKAKFITLKELQKKNRFWELFYLLSRNLKLKDMMKLNILRKKDSLGAYICASLQMMDYLLVNAEVVYGGIDQRGVYVLSREFFGKRGFRKPIILLSNLSHDIIGQKLVDSSLHTRITIHDTKNTLLYKVNKMFCPPGQVDNNPVIEHFRFSVFPFFKKITIELTNGEKEDILNANALIEFYRKGLISPYNLKKTLYEYLSIRLRKVQEFFQRKYKLIEWIDTDFINKRGIPNVDEKTK